MHNNDSFNISAQNKSGVSVVICCYNSVGRIEATLRHLQQQNIPELFNWEIIAVNNASTDDTVAVITNTWKNSTPKNANCRIINEFKQGQMFARITGVREARYECIVFCDDDNLLDRNYIILASEIIFQNETIGAAGGQNLPVTDAATFPDWFKEYESNYAAGKPAAATGDITSNGYVLGAGLITKRSLFLEVFQDKYPSLLNGGNGEQLSTGDDFEYCKRLLLWNYSLYYDERLKLDHFIPQYRLTINYRNRLLDGIAQSRIILSKYDEVISLKNKLAAKNKVRLLLLTPLRTWLIKLGWSKRNLEQEKSVLAYIGSSSTGINAVKAAIIKFAKKE